MRRERKKPPSPAAPNRTPTPPEGPAAAATCLARGRFVWSQCWRKDGPSTARGDEEEGESRGGDDGDAWFLHERLTFF